MCQRERYIIELKGPNLAFLYQMEVPALFNCFVKGFVIGKKQNEKKQKCHLAIQLRLKGLRFYHGSHI